MAMPAAAGLFHGSIVQSGSTLTVGRGEASKTYVLAFAEALGVTPRSANRLNDFTYEEPVAGTRRGGDSSRVRVIRIQHRSLLPGSG